MALLGENIKNQYALTIPPPLAFAFFQERFFYFFVGGKRRKWKVTYF
jgi:hypothetical protein